MAGVTLPRFRTPSSVVSYLLLLLTVPEMTYAQGGNDKDVQFNDGGGYGGESAFEYDKTTDTLTVPNLSSTTGTISTLNVASGGVTITGGSCTVKGTAAFVMDPSAGGGTYIIAPSSDPASTSLLSVDLFSGIADYIVPQSAAVPLHRKTINGQTASGGTRDADSNILQIRRHSTDCTSITDGKDGEFCRDGDDDRLWLCHPSSGDCDTAGEWVTAALPGGSSTQVQFNSSGVLAGDAGLVYNAGSDLLTMAGGAAGIKLDGGFSFLEIEDSSLGLVLDPNGTAGSHLVLGSSTDPSSLAGADFARAASAAGSHYVVFEGTSQELSAKTLASPIIGAAGVQLSGDGDGAITFLGLGDGNDESLTLNLDDGTANTFTFSSASSATQAIWTSISHTMEDLTTFDDVTVGDDLVVTDDATVTGDLTANTVSTNDQTAEPGNLIGVRDNDTAFTNDPTCANSGAAGELRIVDADESSADRYDVCVGTTRVDTVGWAPFVMEWAVAAKDPDSGFDNTCLFANTFNLGMASGCFDAATPFNSAWIKPAGKNAYLQEAFCVLTSAVGEGAGDAIEVEMIEDTFGGASATELGTGILFTQGGSPSMADGTTVGWASLPRALTAAENGIAMRIQTTDGDAGMSSVSLFCRVAGVVEP